MSFTFKGAWRSNSGLDTADAVLREMFTHGSIHVNGTFTYHFCADNNILIILLSFHGWFYSNSTD